MSFLDLRVALVFSLAACSFDSGGAGDASDTGDSATGSSEDASSGGEGTQTGSGEGGDGDTGTGDGDASTGDGDGTTGDGDGTTGDGDGTTGDGDGTTGDGDGTTGDGDGGGQSGSVDVQVIDSNDDAEENGNGEVATISPDLEMADDYEYWGYGQIIGIRFQGVDIPAGATIAAAHLEFTTDRYEDADTSLEINGEADPNPPAFSTNFNDLSQRSATNAGVDWASIPIWANAGDLHQSPDLSSIVQEQVDAPGWNSGQTMSFLITGAGTRVASSYDAGASLAPRLRVDWVLP
jgi:hypothetical protein